MVVSNEPGYYEDGQFGIRIENLLVCPIVRRCMHDLMLSNDRIGQCYASIWHEHLQCSGVTQVTSGRLSIQ